MVINYYLWKIQHSIMINVAIFFYKIDTKKLAETDEYNAQVINSIMPR